MEDSSRNRLVLVLSAVTPGETRRETAGGLAAAAPAAAEREVCVGRRVCYDRRLSSLPFSASLHFCPPTAGGGANARRRSGYVGRAAVPCVHAARPLLAQSLPRLLHLTGEGREQLRAPARARRLPLGGPLPRGWATPTARPAAAPVPVGGPWPVTRGGRRRAARPPRTVLLCRGGLATADQLGRQRPGLLAPRPALRNELDAAAVFRGSSRGVFLVSKARRSTASRGHAATPAATAPCCQECDCPWDEGSGQPTPCRPTQVAYDSVVAEGPPRVHSLPSTVLSVSLPWGRRCRSTSSLGC